MRMCVLLYIQLQSLPKFQSKIRYGEVKTIHAVPLQAQGPKPPMFQNVNMMDAEGEGAKPVENQSFLRKYVRES